MTNPDTTTRPSWLDHAIIGVFLSVIASPLLVTTAELWSGETTPRDEQLAATPAPIRDIGSAKHWPGAFKHYFSQRFGLRKPLLRLHGRAKVMGLGVSSNSSVALGRDGWLYLVVVDHLKVGILADSKAKKSRLSDEVHRFVEHELYL